MLSHWHVYIWSDSSLAQKSMLLLMLIILVVMAGTVCQGDMARKAFWHAQPKVEGKRALTLPRDQMPAGKKGSQC